MSLKLFGPAVAAAAILAFTGVASAEVAGTATLDLNIRSGPGPAYPVVGVIESDSAVVISGCLETGTWCSVDYDGMEGWAYSRYLVADLSGSPVVIEEHRADIGVPVVVYDGPAGDVAAGAVAGALIGGPVGAVVGGAVGATTGVVIDPPPEIRSYVVTNEIEPVYLDGEVVVGAGIPEVVELHPIPEYEYAYVYVNEQPVLVDPETRRIVYVVPG